MNRFSLTIVVLLLCSTSSMAQSRSVIVMIDSTRFESNTNGIDRLNRATQTLLMGHFCQEACSEKGREVATLQREIERLKCANQPLGEREAKLRITKLEYDRLLAAAGERYEHMEKLLVQPVINDIRELLRRFAEAKKYALIVDTTSIFGRPSGIRDEQILDVTDEFIKFANAEFGRGQVK